MSHTPGPWTAEPTRVNGWDSFEIKAADGPITLLMGYREDAPANARLIAASPDLKDRLASLIHAYDRWVRDEIDDAELIAEIGSYAHENRALLAKIDAAGGDDAAPGRSPR